MSEMRIELDRPGYSAGEEVTGTVEVQLDGPVTARGVRLRLHGEEYSHITRSTGKTTVTYYDRDPVVDEEVVFVGEERLATFAEGVTDVWNTVLNRVEHVELPAGVHRYPFAFALPGDGPPSYDGSSAEVEYRLFAYVDVPIWSDLRRRCDVLVYPRAQPVDPSSAVSGRYPRPEDERGFWEDVGTAIRPKIQAALSLPRSRYGIGEMIDGELVVEDTGDAAIRGIEFALVAKEEARASGHTDRIRRQAARVSLEWQAHYGPGTPIPFQIEVPEGLVPTLRRSAFSLEWFVVARLHVALAVDVIVAVPVTIVLGDGVL